MSTIAMALHVARRDLAEHRWIVAGWLVMVALSTFDAATGGRAPEMAGVRIFLLPLGALLLAAGLVQVHPPEGAPSGTPVYLRTLPIPLRAVLLGRVAAAAFLLCGIPLAGQVVALVALDTPTAHLPGYLVASAIPLAGLVLAGLLVGTLVRGLGGAVVLVTGLYLLLLPLAFALSVSGLGSGPGLLPPVPGLALGLHAGVAGLALWMLVLRHALAPGTWWTRIGTVAVVFALLGVSQTGWFLNSSETRAWSSVPPQVEAPGFPVVVRTFDMNSSGAETTLEVFLVLAPGEGVPRPSLVQDRLVTLEDTDGNVLLTHHPFLFSPSPNQPDSDAPYSEIRSRVPFSIPRHHLDDLRSGVLKVVVYGEGVELESPPPVELPLEAGARFTRAGTRLVIDHVWHAGITVRWSAFTPRISIRVPGRTGAPSRKFFGLDLVEIEILTPSGETGGFLQRGSSSGGGFGPSGSSDLVIAGPRRQSGEISFGPALPAPLHPDARLRVHTLQPVRATPFRFVLPPASWD